ncbi:MAG: tRNA (adenosine(37)-N6)-threonylcarbamoyltransferase complex ATPase subunit type 1 TsaE [Candidatus Dormibacteria bacterium]
MNRLNVLRSDDPATTEAYGASLGRVLRAGDLLALNGPLGAGKTCLVRGIAAGAGGGGSTVRSPTFILHQPIRCAHLTLHHVDLYRLGPAPSLDFLDLDNALEEGAVVVEWAEYADLSRLVTATLSLDAPVNMHHRRELRMHEGAAAHLAEAWAAMHVSGRP